MHRYTLVRGNEPYLGVVGLNPSTADDTLDDPTTRRLRRFANDAGFGGYYLVNLSPLRASKPADMLGAPPLHVAGDPEAQRRALAGLPSDVLLAWGCGGGHLVLAPGRAAVLAALAGRTCYALHVTSAGYPGHPLYLPAAARMFRVRARPDGRVERADA